MDGSNELKDRPWFVNPSTGEASSYGSLIASIGENPRIRPLSQPATARGALEELVRAAATGTRLTLLDRSLTRSEAERLGIDVEAINREVSCVARHSAVSFPRWLAGSDNPGFVLELFTSGSTGLPGRVAHSLDTLGRAVRVSDRHAEDIWALAYPPTHVAGVQVALQAMRNGNTLVDVTELRGAEAVEAIIRHGVTHVPATPTYYRLIAAAKQPMPQVRAVSLGGEPADWALLTTLHEVFPNARLRNIYASTEAGTILESEDEVFTLPAHLAGRLKVQGGRLHVHRSLLGQFNDSASSPEAEWYDTGDSAEVVTETPLRFRITGRRKEWVNVGGDKVNPLEVEAVLRQHPSVQDVVVSGRPNSVLGSLLEAEVVLHSAGVAEAELRAFLGERLQPFKVPRIIRFVPELKTTFTGKALRR
jgi:acyl-coenzyme A synthetase/AMP-(fatty) acid ligase